MSVCWVWTLYVSGYTWIVFKKKIKSEDTKIRKQNKAKQNKSKTFKKQSIKVTKYYKIPVGH